MKSNNESRWSVMAAYTVQIGKNLRVSAGFQENPDLRICGRKYEPSVKVYHLAVARTATVPAYRLAYLSSGLASENRMVVTLRLD